MGLKSGSKSGKGGKQGTVKVTTGKTQPQVPSNVADSDDEPEVDNSVLRPSIEISVSGVPQLVQAYQTATKELRSVLSKECDLIYECRVCRNLFRSVANMMAHKRVYCKKTYSFSRQTVNRSDMVEDYTMVIQPEPVPSSSQERENWSTSDKVPDNMTQNNLTDIQVVSSTLKISSYKCPRKGLKDVVDELKRNTLDNSKVMSSTSTAKLHDTTNTSVLDRKTDHQEHNYQLEDIDTSKVGKFQTRLASSTSSSEKEDLMKAQVSELQNMSSRNEAVIGPDGQTIITNGPLSSDGTDMDNILQRNELKSSTDEHVCPDCKVKFSTRKTLNHHMKSLHVTFRLCYPCPCCKSTFVNPWSVYRHLYKVHRKTNAQVRRLRPQIQRKAFKKEMNNETLTTDTNSKNEILKESQRLDQENQEWMDNFEDDLELQRCGGCGRRFERRAALNSHSQICQKRIAARNNIKSIQKVTSSCNSEKTGKTDIESIEVEANRKTDNMNNNIDSINNSPGTSKVQLNNNNWTETKKETPKKIEIQIRKDYCKMSSASSVQALSTDTQSEPDSRPSSRIAEDENLDNEDDIREWGSMIEEDGFRKNETSYMNSQDQCHANDSNSLQKFNQQFVEEMANTRKRRACSEEQNSSLSGSPDAKEGETIKQRQQQNVNEQDTYCSNNILSSKIRRVEEFHPVMTSRMQDFINLRRLQCLPCQKKFNKLTNLRRHVAVHIGWCRYKCTLCNFKCFSKYDCVDHVRKVHLKGGQRSKAATMVEFIKEQNLETENMKNDVPQTQSHPSDSPSHDDEDMHDLMDSTVHSLNLEDIRNIVGVTSYPEPEIESAEQEKPEEPSVEYTKKSDVIEDKNTPEFVNSRDNLGGVEILEIHSVELQTNIASPTKQEKKDISEEINEHPKCSESEVCEREIKKEAIDEIFNAVEDKMNVDSCNASKVPYEEKSDKVLDNKEQTDNEEIKFKEQELETEPVSELESEGELDKSIEVIGIFETQKGKIEPVNEDCDEGCDDCVLIEQEDQIDSSNTCTKKEVVSPDPIVETSLHHGTENDQQSELRDFCEKEPVGEEGIPSKSTDQKLDECIQVSSSDSLQADVTIKQEIDDIDADAGDASEDFASEGCISTADSANEVIDKQTALRKMVMEVIFGSGDTSGANSDANQNLFSMSLNGNACDGESSESTSSRASPTSDVEIVVNYRTDNHMSSESTKSSKSRNNIEHGSTVEYERRERPVRNRVKVAKEGFIYDFSESFLRKEETSKAVNKKKQVDSGKDSLKSEASRSVDVCKYLPKLMLVRTEETGTAKGTWSSVYAHQLANSSNKSSIATNPQMYSAARKPPVYEQ